MGNMSKLIQEPFSHIWIDSINDVQVRSKEYVEDDKMISIRFSKENRVIPLSLLYEGICEYCFITCTTIYDDVIVILMKSQPFLSLQIDGDNIPTEQVTNLQSGITYTIKMNSANDGKIHILWIKDNVNPTILCLGNNEFNDSCLQICQSKNIKTSNKPRCKAYILILIITIFYIIFCTYILWYFKIK